MIQRLLRVACVEVLPWLYGRCQSRSYFQLSSAHYMPTTVGQVFSGQGPRVCNLIEFQSRGIPTLTLTKRTKQSCWATPLAIDDRIYWFGKDGLCTVISTGRDFEILSENAIWSENALLPDELPIRQEVTEDRQAAAANFSGPTVYGYAVAGDRIIVRIGNQLFCLGGNVHE